MAKVFWPEKVKEKSGGWTQGLIRSVTDLQLPFSPEGFLPKFNVGKHLESSLSGFVPGAAYLAVCGLPGSQSENPGLSRPATCAIVGSFLSTFLGPHRIYKRLDWK